MFGEDGYGGWFFREFLRYHRTALLYPLPNLPLRMQLAQLVRYPPLDPGGETISFIDWMRSAALSTLAVIRRCCRFSAATSARSMSVAATYPLALQPYRSFPELPSPCSNMPQPTDMVESWRLNAWDRIGGIAGRLSHRSAAGATR